MKFMMGDLTSTEFKEVQPWFAPTEENFGFLSVSFTLAKTISEFLKILNKTWPDIHALTLGMCKFWIEVHLAFKN